MRRKNPEATVSSSTVRPSMAIVDARGGTSAREIAAADHQRDAAGPAANPALNRRAARAAAVLAGDAGRFRRQRPSLAEIPARRIDSYQSISFGRTPPMRTGYGSGHRYRPCALGGGRRAPDRCAADRRRTRPARGRRRSSTSPARAIRAWAAPADAARTAASRSPIHAIGRRRSSSSRRCIASTGGRSTAGATRVRMSSSSRNAGASCRAYAAMRRAADARVDSGEAADERRAARRRRSSDGTADGEIRDRHDQRQRVPGRDGLLKQQVEDEVRPERDDEHRAASAVDATTAAPRRRSARTSTTAATTGAPTARRTRSRAPARAAAASASSTASRRR